MGLDRTRSRTRGRNEPSVSRQRLYLRSCRKRGRSFPKRYNSRSERRSREERSSNKRRSSVRRCTDNSDAKGLSRPLVPGTRWQVYCDLDGVLADFDRAVVERTGTMPKDFRRRRRMWRYLAPPRTSDFFSKLPWMNGGDKLWSFLAPLSPRILSGSPHGDWAAPQKRQWCAEQLNLSDDRVLIVPPSEKALFSHPGAVLVDDWLEHRKGWEERGGIFVHYTTAMETIPRLAVVLRKLEDLGALPPAWPSVDVAQFLADAANDLAE